jgi:hypothetical protein
MAGMFEDDLILESMLNEMYAFGKNMGKTCKT